MKFDNLQALRGVACLAVVVYHVAEWERGGYGLRTTPVREFQWFGFAGVDLFFVLSGFIITHTNRRNLGRPAAAPGYLFRRLWRIYPPFWAAAALAGLSWAWALNNPVLTPGWEAEWVHWLALLPGEPANRYVAPAWTLTYEVIFYLAFVALILLPPRVGWVLLAGWGAAVAAALAGWAPDGGPYAALALSPFVLEFLAGCLVAHLIGRGVRGHGRAAIVLGCVWAATATLVARPFVAGEWTAVIPILAPVRVAVFGPAAALIVYGMAAAELAGTVRAPRWLRTVGDASYSIYLTHCTVGALAVVYGCLMPHSKDWHRLWLAGTTLGCVGFGLAFYFTVERPLLRLAHRRKAIGGSVAAVVPKVPARRAA